MSWPVVLFGAHPYIRISVYADVPATGLTLAQWEDREFEYIHCRLNALRRRNWCAAQDEETFDPENTPQRVMEERGIRVRF
ncbi:hypothetical protein CDAR_397791 [Caerostris darwini]|uniref:Uncharacterized protein n=1 Tax=Caerostris darwini TaxID=1538125 RepID=A0AAV4VVH7_9ARAC|nr:hypothetical protein CDAR_487391 [Caerostris darwini]GIY73959.1 hypothetical protein CDAR_397791 [Caerostris darwini]